MLKQLFATKSIDALRDSATESNGLHRTLGVMDLTLLGIGAIMGTGIFVVTGRAAAANAGPAVVLSFLIAAITAALAALCYAEMAAMIPIAGSSYTYAYAAMGEFAAFLIGWTLMLSYSVSVALVSVGWSGYAKAFIQHITGYVLPFEWSAPPFVWNEVTHAFDATGAFVNIPAIFITMLLSCCLVFGISGSAKLNAVIVYIKLGVVLLFIGASIAYINPDNWQPFIPPNEGVFGKFGISGIFQAATTVFVSYIGFDAVSVAAQESKNPQRDTPIGILLSLFFCTILYVAVSFVLTGVVSYQELSVPNPIAIGIAKTGMVWLETVIDIGAIAGLSSVILVLMLALPRIIMTIAADGLLPSFAAKIHPKFGTPLMTTLVAGAVCSMLGGFLSIDVLGELVSLCTLFVFVLVSLGVMILRVKKPNIPRPFRVPFGPFVIPLISATISILLMYTASSHTVYRMLWWMLIGCVFYALYCRRHSLLRQHNARIQK